MAKTPRYTPTSKPALPNTKRTFTFPPMANPTKKKSPQQKGATVGKGKS